MITDCSNFDKRCSDAHFGPLLFYYYCNNGVFKTEVTQKKSLTKNVLLNSYSSLKNFFRKIRMIFDIGHSPALRICRKI